MCSSQIILTETRDTVHASENHRAVVFGAMKASPLFAVLLSVYALGAPAQEHETSEDDKQLMTLTVNTLSKCAGVYAVVAQVLDTGGQPANAENARGLARGAESAAMYLLGHEHVAAGNTPKPYGEFKPYVDGIVETTRILRLSMLEAGDADALRYELEQCMLIRDVQVELVQQMRDEFVGR